MIAKIKKIVSRSRYRYPDLLDKEVAAVLRQNCQPGRPTVAALLDIVSMVTGFIDVQSELYAAQNLLEVSGVQVSFSLASHDSATVEAMLSVSCLFSAANFSSVPACSRA